jgi:5-methylcytosine-specific restriction endonuclease McrA
MEALLNHNVLVLNRLWQAVNICSVRRALTLLFAGHAEVVCAQNGAFDTFDFSEWRNFSDRNPQEADSIHAVRFRIRIPKVVMLLIFDRLPRKEVKFTRHNIFERDNNTCQYCGKIFDRRDLNIDHVIPRDRGGASTWENVVCSCIPCNTKKGNRTPSETGIRLIRKPKRPKWRPFVQISFSKSGDDSWKHFLDLAYWNVELGEEPEGNSS